MFLLTLNRIVLLDRPDEQTRSFFLRVQSWMAQWTVANNYHQIVIQNKDKDDEQAALELWALKFEAAFKSAIGEVWPAAGIRHDFAFDYEANAFDIGKEVMRSSFDFRRITLHDINPD